MLRVIRSETDLTGALRERRLALHVSQEQVEHDVGLTRAHLGKIENAHRPWGKRVFRMTATFEWLLEYYGQCLVIIDVRPALVRDLQALGADALMQLAVGRRTYRAYRCPFTIDMFRGAPDAELAV